MAPLISLLLLTLGVEATPETHYPGASPVFQCNFESTRDEDLYGWPPGWTRRQGPGFPRYVRVRVDADHPPPGGCSLRVELNGGAATAYGPAVAVNPDVQYVLEGYVATNGLRHDCAYLSVIFLDATRTRLRSVESEKICGDSPWQKVRLGPISPPAGASLMLVGVHVESQGEAQDLHGTASFGALWLGQLPRVTLTAQPAEDVVAKQDAERRNVGDEKRPPARNANDASFLVFPRGQPIDVACVVSGFAAPTCEIRMQLLDFDGRKLAERRQTLDRSSSAVAAEKQKVSFSRLDWRLPGDALGFYRVRATIAARTLAGLSSARAAPPTSEAATQVELSFVVVEPQVLPMKSEFGWSLGPKDADVGLVPLGDLLCQSGVHWVKFPFALAEPQPAPVADALKAKTESPGKPDAALPKKSNRAAKETSPEAVVEASVNSKTVRPDSIEPLITFSDRLGQSGIGIAGVLLPPRVADPNGKGGFNFLAAEAFSRDPKTWYPSIEPILARLATEIRFWQLGDDRDPGWIGCRDLAGVVARTKGELDRIGQDLGTGIAWNLAAPLPIIAASPKADRLGGKSVAATAAVSKPQKTPWRFLSLPCDEAMSDEALARRLEDTKSAGIARWILLDGLPREGHTSRERIAHLVSRMLTAKMHGAEGIFASNPLDGDCGLLDRNGSAGELFLPWRTTSLLLGGAPYAGPIDLPHSNQIQCFGRKGNYIGVLAAGKPSQEAVYLGPDLHVQDLWGNRRPCPPTISADNEATGFAAAPRSVITVEELPTFLVGLDSPVTEWQLAAALSPSRLPSIPSALAPVALELKNTFPQAISGRVNILGPQNWHIEPRNAEFRLEPGAAWKQLLEVALPNDVVGGRQMIHLDFEIQADHLCRFSMVRPLEVTLGDVDFTGQAVLDGHGQMEVHQTLINRGKKAAGFRCDLLAPDRRRQSTEVVLEPSGKSEQTYRLPDGGQLSGKTLWLRAEEIDGPRVLNYRLETPAAAVPTNKPAETSKPRPSPRDGSSLVL